MQPSPNQFYLNFNLDFYKYLILNKQGQIQNYILSLSNTTGSVKYI